MIYGTQVIGLSSVEVANFLEQKVEALGLKDELDGFTPSRYFPQEMQERLISLDDGLTITKQLLWTTIAQIGLNGDAHEVNKMFSSLLFRFDTEAKKGGYKAEEIAEIFAILKATMVLLEADWYPMVRNKTIRESGKVIHTETLHLAKLTEEGIDVDSIESMDE
jgi:hypothetical protein